MMIVHKIDVTTGNFIEDCQFANLPILEDGQPDPQYVEEAPPQGLYLPRYLNGVWVEGGVAPDTVEPEPQAPIEAERIEILENMLLLLMME